MTINFSSGGLQPDSRQLIADLFRTSMQNYDIHQPGPQPPRPQTDAKELGKLLETLADLLEQAVEQHDTEGAAEGLLDLLEQHGIDIQDYMDASREVEQAMQALKAALQSGQNSDLERIERQELIEKALAQLQNIYAERNRRQLEMDWDFIWRQIYLDDRRRQREAGPEQLQLPTEVNQGEAAAALTESSLDPVRSSRIQQHLGQQSRELAARQAVVLHAAASLLLEDVAGLDASSVQDRADALLARIDEFSAWVAQSADRQ